MPRMYCSHVAYCTTLHVQTLTTSRLQEILAQVELNLIIFRRSNFSKLVVSPEIPVAKGGTMWARNGRWILPEMPDFQVAFRNLLHAVNLWYGTDGFTSLPKEGVLRIFSPWKIRRVWTRELRYQRPARYLQTTEAACKSSYVCAYLFHSPLLPISPLRWTVFVKS